MSLPPVCHSSYPYFQNNSFELTEMTSTAPSSLELKDCTIPCFDISAISSSQGQERINQIESFCKSLHEVGFVAIKFENLASLLDSVFEQMADYFNQSNDRKLENLRNSDPWDQDGYFADLPKRERFQMSSEFKKFPNSEYLPQFKNVMEQYYQECSRYMECALRLILEYCHENPDKDCLNVKNHMRLIKYLAFNSQDASDDFWLRPHTDVTVLTLLPSNDVPGLQMFTKENKWVDVLVPKGYLILSTGRQLEHKSAGYFSAPLHQVVKPGEQWEGSNRYTAVFYSHWPNEFSLKPFDSRFEAMCTDLSHNEKEIYLKNFPDQTVKEWLETFVESK
jgi:isopenicillin N synthase-like dioxygenase